jgi:hypothetical protein
VINNPIWRPIVLTARCMGETLADGPLLQRCC